VAVGRGFKSAKLLAAARIVTDDVLTDKYMTTTCKITRCGLGGPLIDFEGNSVGINFYTNSEGNAFLPRNKIHESLSVIWDQVERDKIIDKNPPAIQTYLIATCCEGGSSSMQQSKKKKKKLRGLLPENVFQKRTNILNTCVTSRFYQIFVPSLMMLSQSL
jgi:hypothetical protein